jgi:tetratricopeptide (TPR) repeat protein
MASSRVILNNKKPLGNEAVNEACALHEQAVTAREAGAFAQAEAWARQALVCMEQAAGPEHLDVANVRLNRGGLCEDQARYAEAENLYRRSITLKEQLLGPDHPDVALAVGNLGGLYAGQGRYAEATACYR